MFLRHPLTPAPFLTSFLYRHTFLVLVAVLFSPASAAAFADNDVVPVTVSAASYETTAIAPDSIVATFGTKLATGTFVGEDSDSGTAGVQLPTTLGGTTVRINGQAAGLLFVSPNQINFVIPSNATSGTATVQITSGDGTVSTGATQISQVAPSIFSGNADGQGVPAAYLVRAATDGSLSYESVSQLSSSRLITRPIDLGPEGELVFLVLFLSGISHASDPNSDNNFSENLRVVMGGTEIVPAYAGRQGFFVGLDQINVQIPRSLIGRGKVSLSVAATGFSTSKTSEIEIASPAGDAPPVVSGFSSSSVLAGQTLTITGSGFAENEQDNTVRISGAEATVTAASATQVSVQVPYGASGGMVSVRTAQGEGMSSSALALRTSISGFVEDTSRQPMSGVIVRVAGTGTQVTTNSEGLFVLPDVGTGAALVEIDAGSITSPPFPKVTLKMAVSSNRDNQFSRPVSLQQATGASLSVGSGGSNEAQSVSVPFSSGRHSGRYSTAGTITSGNVTFDLPTGSATFPDGATSGTIYLTLLDNSRTPVDLPGGHFSTAIAQLSPFGVTLNPGGKLTFPNPEGLAAGTEGTLFRFEQNQASADLGKFVEAGSARVSSDGQRIETADGAITKTGIYFVSRLRQMTTVTGRVFDSNGTTPVRNALVRTRGQETFTDGNGGFIIRNVPVKAGETISVEASFLRANGRIDRKQSAEVPVIVGGITAITPDIVLPAPALNRPPAIQAPFTLTINEGQNIDIRVAAFDPDQGQTVTLTLTGPGFASLIETTEKLIRLAPGFNDAGTYTLTLTAKDNLNATTTRNIALTVNNINRPPASSGQSLSTNEDTALNITLSASDPDGDTITYILLLAPTHGTLSGTAPNLTYTPANNYNGSDSFTFKVNDGRLDSPVYTVSLTINQVNDAPTISVPGQQTVFTEDNVSFTISGADVDAGQTLSYSVLNPPPGSNFNPTTRQFTWVPPFNQVGTYDVDFRVQDNFAPPASVTGRVRIVVNPVLNWTQNADGPNGGEIFTLTGSASNLMAGTNEGIFRSTDGGSSWFKSNGNLPPGGRIVAFAGSGTNGFIARPGPGANDGVFRTTDSGGAWTQVNNGLTNRELRALLLVGTNLVAATAGGGVFRSTDNGANWSQVNTGLQSMQVNSLAASGTLLYAGTDQGVSVSSDGGANWSSVNSGLPTSPVFIPALLIDGSKIYAAVNSGVYEMPVGGTSWNDDSAGLPAGPPVITLAVIGTDLFAGTNGMGVFRTSTISAPFFNQVSNGLRNPAINFLHPVGSTLYAGTMGGVWQTTDNGANWNPATAGIRLSRPRCFAQIGSTLFVGTQGDGVFKSTDSGGAWISINNGLQSIDITALGASGTDLFAGTNGQGLYKSSDNGATWAQIEIDYTVGSPVTAILIHGSDIYASTIFGVIKSPLSNFSFTPVNTGLTNLNVRSLAATANDIYAATDGGGVFRTIDFGANWSQVGNTSTGLTNENVRSLTVDSTYIYAGTAGGVFRMPLTIANWTAVNTGLANTDINALTSASGKLFAATPSGVFISTDSGAKWKNGSFNLMNPNVRAVFVSGSRVFAGTDGSAAWSTSY
jgi:uncharacterized protein (TIGR03437 family)